MLRKTYVQVDLSAIAHNIRQLKRTANTQVMAVVKADAYGHGMEQVARVAMEEGVEWFAVATADEAVRLRDVTPAGHILLLSAPEDVQSAAALVAADIAMCVYTPAHIRMIAEQCALQHKQAAVHIKIDTGMHRIGLQTAEELAELLDCIKAQPDIAAEGVFTHFAKADMADPVFTGLQAERFANAVKQIREAGFDPLCHAANSAAIVAYPDTHWDLCRMGISMYGYPASEDVEMGDIELKPALQVISHITHVKTIGPGEGVSYGLRFVAQKPEKVATVSIGYADGYLRAFSDKACAQLGDKDIPCIGRVCMDQTMFCVTDTDAAPGDAVKLLGERITAQTLAELAGTISYEVLTGLTARLPRVYIHA